MSGVQHTPEGSPHHTQTLQRSGGPERPRHSAQHAAADAALCCLQGQAQDRVVGSGTCPTHTAQTEGAPRVPAVLAACRCQYGYRPFSLNRLPRDGACLEPRATDEVVPAALQSYRWRHSAERAADGPLCLCLGVVDKLSAVWPENAAAGVQVRQQKPAPAVHLEKPPLHRWESTKEISPTEGTGNEMAMRMTKT